MNVPLVIIGQTEGGRKLIIEDRDNSAMDYFMPAAIFQSNGEWYCTPVLSLGMAYKICSWQSVHITEDIILDNIPEYVVDHLRQKRVRHSLH